MSDTTEKARYSAHVRSIIAGRVFGVPHQSTIDTAPNPQPGLQSEQTGSPPQIKSSKRKTLADSTNDDTDAKRPKLDDPGNNEPADDSSLPAIVLDDLDTVISKFKQNLRKMKVLLDGGRFSDVEELAQEAPRFSELLRKQSRVQIELMKKNLQKKNEMEEKMNEMEEKRKEMEEKMSELEEKRKEMEEESKEKDTEQEKTVHALRAQLAESEATESLHSSALESIVRDIGGAVVFRAMLNHEEVTVTFTPITKSEEAVVTICYEDRRKAVWHDKLDKCVAAIKAWDWFLCLDQSPAKPGFHLYNLMDEDVAGLPSSLRRRTGRGVCFCRGHIV